MGVVFNSRLTWSSHVDYICGKAAKRIYLLCLLKRAGRPPNDIVSVYKAIIRSVLEYASEVWHPALTVEQSNQLEHIQKRSLYIAHPDLDYDDALCEYNLDTLKQRRINKCKCFFIEICKPSHKLNYLLPDKNESRKLMYRLPKVRTERFKKSPINYCLFNFQK